MIKTTDISSDEDLARRVLVRARSIAPCIDNLTDEESEPYKNAVAILKGVIAELPEAGTARARSLSRNGTSMSFEIASAFTADVITSLRSLCESSDQRGYPQGSFPTDTVLERLWPEEKYS